MRGSLALYLIAGAALASSPAFAQRHWASGDEAYHRHEGLFMRLDAGGGFLKAATTINGSSGALSGAAGSFGFSLGGNVVEDLSLFGHVGISVVTDPQNTLPGALSTSGTTLSFAAVGPGMNYYFMPANAYVSGMLLITRLTISGDNTSGSTQAGFGAKVAVGKEWWVGEHWGMGIAGQLTFGSNADQDTGTGSTPTWTTITPALAFSASFN